MRYFIPDKEECEEICQCGAKLYYTDKDYSNIEVEEIDRTFPPGLGNKRIDVEKVAYIICPVCKKRIRILLSFNRTYPDD